MFCTRGNDNVLRAGSFFDIDLHLGKKHEGEFKQFMQNISDDNGISPPE
jgi:hypothetical protein